MQSKVARFILEECCGKSAVIGLLWGGVFSYDNIEPTIIVVVSHNDRRDPREPQGEVLLATCRMRS